MEVIVFLFQPNRSQCLIPVHVLIEKESLYHIFTLLMRNYGMMDETQKNSSHTHNSIHTKNKLKKKEKQRKK